MAIFALIVNDIITNVIVADQAFIDSNHGLVYDNAVDITNISPQPAVGWSFSQTQWVPAAGPSLSQKIDASLTQAQAYGQALMKTFMNQNVQMGITQAGKTQLIADATHNLYHYLITGSLYAAIAELDQMSTNLLLGTWAPYITAPILESYKNQIQAWLGVPLT